MDGFCIYAGDVDKTIYLRLRDSTTGLAKTGLAYNSAGAVASYVLPLAARAAIALATQTVTGAHSDGGFVEIDATNCKGLYRLDLPDAAIASGNFTLISIEFDGIIEESILIPLHVSKANVTQWLGTACSAPTVAGVPNVNAKTWNDLATVALPLVPTVAGRTLDVSAGGEAGLDWANVGSPTTTVGLSGTTVKTATDVETDTADIQSRIPAALVSGRMDSSVGAMAANVLTASALAADAVQEIWEYFLVGSITAGDALLTAAQGPLGSFTVNDAGATTTTFITDLTSSVDDFYNDMQLTFTTGALTGQIRVVSDYVGSTKTVTLDEALTSAPANGVSFNVGGPHTHSVGSIADAVLDELLSAHTAAGSLGKAVADTLVDTAEIGAAGAGLTNINLPNQTMDIVGNITGNLSGSVGSVTGLTASNLDAAVSTRATPAQILTTAMSESYAANGVAPTLAQAMFAIHQMLQGFAIAGTSYTVKKLDGSTTAFILTLDDAVTPTAAART